MISTRKIFNQVNHVNQRHLRAIIASGGTGAAPNLARPDQIPRC